MVKQRIVIETEIPDFSENKYKSFGGAKITFFIGDKQLGDPLIFENKTLEETIDKDGNISKMEFSFFNKKTQE